jgi:hypothetical protein
MCALSSASAKLSSGEPMESLMIASPSRDEPSRQDGKSSVLVLHMANQPPV